MILCICYCLEIISFLSQILKLSTILKLGKVSKNRPVHNWAPGYCVGLDKRKIQEFWAGGESRRTLNGLIKFAGDSSLSGADALPGTLYLIGIQLIFGRCLELFLKNPRFWFFHRDGLGWSSFFWINSCGPHNLLQVFLLFAQYFKNGLVVNIILSYHHRKFWLGVY